MFRSGCGPGTDIPAPGTQADSTNQLTHLGDVHQIQFVVEQAIACIVQQLRTPGPDTADRRRESLASDSTR